MRKIIVLCLAVFISTPLLGVMPITADEYEIRRVEDEACKAYLHSDADGLAKLLTEDFVFTNGQAEMNDKDAELAEVRAKAVRFTAFENSEMVVRRHGDQAVVTGITLVEGTPVGGKPFSLKVRFTDVLTRTDGHWRLIAGHVSRIPKKEN